MNKKKSNHIGSEGGEKSLTIKGGHLQKKLTKTEEVVLSLLTVEFLTPREVSRRRKTSLETTRTHIKNLKKKGFLGSHHHSPSPHSYTPLPMGVRKHKIRLHAERYRLRIIGSPSFAYVDARRRCSSVLMDENRVVLERDSLVVYSGQSFFGDSPEAAEAAALVYWPRFFSRLESRFGVVLLKPHAQNIKLFFYHFAEVGNELAGDLRVRKQKLRVFGSEDGKEWLLFDDSDKLDEAETTRPPTAEKSAKDDMRGVVQPFFNDLRDNDKVVLLPSELSRSLSETAFFVRENAASLGLLLKLLRPQEPEDVVDDDWRPDYVG